MICKLNLPPVQKLYLSSINPTNVIKHEIDIIKFKCASIISKNNKKKYNRHSKLFHQYKLLVWNVFFFYLVYQQTVFVREY